MRCSTPGVSVADAIVASRGPGLPPLRDLVVMRIEEKKPLLVATCCLCDVKFFFDRPAGADRRGIVSIQTIPQLPWVTDVSQVELQKIYDGFGRLPDYRSRKDDLKYEVRFTITRKP